VSAIGISLANTLVLAISSALGSLVPLLFSYQGLLQPAGLKVLCGVAIEIVGIVLCGRAGQMREAVAGFASDRGDLVGKPRSLGVALLLAIGSGTLSAVFNIGFTLAQPVIAYGRAAGLSAFDSTNLVWWVMLGSGSVANLAFCGYLFAKSRNLAKFGQPGSTRLYVLAALMALLWGGSIFVYGAAAPRLGSLGTAIGWPLSLATGLLLANAIGIGLGEWRAAPPAARKRMYAGIAVLAVAIVVLSRAQS
jgi:L-rhamnose-H+ transport protein